MRKCAICKNKVLTPKYHMDRDLSKYTKLSFRIVLENILELNTKLEWEWICGVCANLLNEFDKAHMILKNLKLQILSYFQYNGDLCINSSNLFNQRALFNRSTLSLELDNSNVTQEWRLEKVKDEEVEDESKSQIGFKEVSILNSPLHVAVCHTKGIGENGNIDNISTNNSNQTDGGLLPNSFGELHKSKSFITSCIKISNTNSVSEKQKKPILGLELEEYKCTTCLKIWNSKSALDNHMLTHNPKIFICDVCGQGYKRKTALDIHVGMHNGMYPFICTHCNKSFTQRIALLRHIRIHTGETPYQCELCGKRFAHHTSFNFHKLTHSGKKNYKCSICDFALFSQSHLHRHMRVHTEERNYVCSSCGKKFAEKYNLRAHEKLHQTNDNDTNITENCQT